MATTPYFILSPNTVLSIIGLIHGPDKTVPHPAEDWRNATVDVVIPTFNEESNIPLCLTPRPRWLVRDTRIHSPSSRTASTRRSRCEHFP